MNPSRMWLVSPVYLDVESYLRVREHVLDVAAGHDQLRAIPIEFVVVDDTAGSDPDIDALRKLSDVTVIEPPFNLGHQRAIVYGLRVIATRVSDSDLVVTLDGDGEDRPEDLPRLLQPLLANTDDLTTIVLARRTRRRTTLTFKIMYFFFALLFRILTGTWVRTGNYGAYRGWQAKRMLLHPSFDLSYSATLLSLHLRVELVPCERGPRYAGRSRMGYSRLFMHGLRMLMPFLDRIAMRVLTLFSLTLGLALALSAVIIGVRLFTEAAVPAWATYALIGTAAFSLVTLGSFVTVFAVFSQSRAISLSNIDQPGNGRSRGSPPRSD